MSTTELENILRRAPQPRPPGNLQQRLKAQALSMPRLASSEGPVPCRSESWLRRWWPVLAPSVVSLACAATLTYQRNELQHLQAEPTVNSSPVPGSAQADPTIGTGSGTKSASATPQEELTRLQNLAARLQAEIAKLEQVKTENDKLRAQIAARSGAVFSSEETKAMEEARDKALNIQCINNLKQLGLAVRVWSMDHQNIAPTDMLSMSNEIGALKILVCPADTGRQPANDWTSYSPANCSYEYLGALAPDTEPQRIAFRCPIHGNLGLIDGSVQMSIVKSHPNWIVQRNGKSYMEVPAVELGTNAVPQEGSAPEDSSPNQ